ncbi:MAG: hypothetical protein BGO34_10275 [Bacteroidia bacterium 44-10]|nr:MAG: hypothetical protein BGO34_10275 [Bacteroidia bacterium 44-10]
MGGQQLYITSKAKWLKNNGYRVNIIASAKGEIYINDLKQYKDNIIEELTVIPYWFNRRKRNSIIEKVTKIIGRVDDDIIIESSNQPISVWGEIIAKRLNAKHLFFSLQEKNTFRTKDLYEYLAFKLKRGELAGIKEETFRTVFKYNWKSVPKLRAYMSNIPEDYEYELLNELKPVRYTIGMIGRLGKPFVLPVIKEINEFVSHHKDDSFNLIMIGGSSNKKNYKRIKSYCEKTDNLNLYVTGFIYPIPLQLIQIPDVFISSAGSSIISAHYNKITISIDSQDYNPIGVLGVTTQNTIYRDSDEPIMKLDDLLADVLINSKYKQEEINLKVSIFNPDYSDHIEFLNKSADTIDYYDFDFNKPKYKVGQFIINCLGSTGIKNLKRIRSKL